jgi:hypothetical protein
LKKPYKIKIIGERGRIYNMLSRFRSAGRGDAFAPAVLSCQEDVIPA